MGILAVIDARSWKELSFNKCALGYDSLRNRLICYEKDRDSNELFVGWYPVYTLEDLFRKAEAAVGTMRLSEEEKGMYGLE